VLFQEPPPSPGEIHFSLFGIPIRVHPWFWILAAVLGMNICDKDLALLLIWVVAVFISILCHELGHALVIRAFGNAPWITLYAMGGLTSHDPRRNMHARGRNVWGQILISFAGPGAGFLLIALILGILMATGYRDKIFFGVFFNLVPAVLIADNVRLTMFLNFLFLVTMMWGFINLLPIFPLDGGKIVQELFVYISPRRGFFYALWLSIVTASIVALHQLFYYRSINCLLFGYFAYENYQVLRAYFGPQRR
jgi:membrane-associated protease RseP (regulator of RpoE activity)